MATQLEGQNERNFLLLYRLVVESTRVLKAKFDSFIPPGTALGTWLPGDKDLKKAKLSEKQIRLMKKYSSSEKFDVSMLISLLRHFCLKADKNNPLWDETFNIKIPTSLCDDIANIVRIRNLRNQVCAFSLHLDILSPSLCLKLRSLVI